MVPSRRTAAAAVERLDNAVPQRSVIGRHNLDELPYAQFTPILNKLSVIGLIWESPIRLLNYLRFKALLMTQV